MTNIELAIIYETHKKYDLDFRDRIEYGEEITSIFEKLSKNEIIKEDLEENIHTFNYSETDTLIEGLELSKQKLEIQIENNNRRIQYSKEQKALFNIEIEKAINEIDTAQKEIRIIRRKHLGKADI